MVLSDFGVPEQNFAGERSGQAVKLLLTATPANGARGR